MNRLQDAGDICAYDERCGGDARVMPRRSVVADRGQTGAHRGLRMTRYSVQRRREQDAVKKAKRSAQGENDRQVFG